MITEQISLASRPKGMPTLNNFRFEEIELPKIQSGQVLIKGWYYSVDPYMRGRMNDTKSYVLPFQIDQPIEGNVVAKVIDSKSDLFKTGDIVLGMLPWRKDIIASEKDIRQIDTKTALAGNYLGILGMTGLTAYFGIMHIGKPKATDTVVVSGAAGAVGLVAGQIAKIQGCHVIGITGSDEKVKVLKDEFDFDGVINYKTEKDLQKAVATLCPNGVDIYFDNVGGEISDAVMSNLNFHARVVLCGQISLYNNTITSIGPRIQPMLVTRSVLMQGFIVSDFQSQFSEGIDQIGQWMKVGKLRFTETIVHGFDQLPTALLGLFKGKNIGKMIVEA
ncbi:MAG: NADP-dependent oxidoreductase [Bacteroidales bacterium]|nr:NADP-dependent oxidoreductase [Bacteroidales bacterium]